MSADETSIFLDAIAISDEASRNEFVARACGDDQTLREQVLKLIDVHFRSGSFLQRPPVNALNSLPGSEVSSSAAVPRKDASSEERLSGSGNRVVDAKSANENSTELVDRYRLIRIVGEGGMGVVWEAEQAEPVKRRVALKIIKPGMDSRRFIQRLQTEMQALALMDHSNIARILDAGTSYDGQPYFVMELLTGLPITRFCDQYRLSLIDRIRLFLTVCHAIQHAHQKGIIHRDIKPSNVLVTMEDGHPVPKVIDFGVAKALSGPLAESIVQTEIGQMIGTLEYMSPEQAAFDSHDIDTRADIYALGAMLYEMLTGSPPFSRHQLKTFSYSEMLRLIREVEPTRPSVRVEQRPTGATGEHPAERKHDPGMKRGTEDTSPPGDSEQASSITEPSSVELIGSHGRRSLRDELDWIVMKCLEKDRTRRYVSVDSLAKDLQRYLDGEPVEACPPSSTYRLRKFARRNRGLLLAAIAVVSSLVLGLIGTLWQLSRAETLAASELKLRKTAEGNEQRAIDAGEREKEQAAIARRNAAEAESHRQQINDILHSLVVDVERGLKDIPGAASVRKRIVAQVLEQLGTLSEKLQDSSSTSLSTAMTLAEMGDLFLQFGTANVDAVIQRDSDKGKSPIEVAERLYNDAMMMIDKAASNDPQFDVRLDRSGIQLKLASLYRQSGRTAEAIKILDDCIATRRQLQTAESKSGEKALALAMAYEMLGQIRLQNSELDQAQSAFLSAKTCCEPFADAVNADERINEFLSNIPVRLGDIAIAQGQIERAEEYYADDLKQSEARLQAAPENLTRQRSFCVSCDRIGNLMQDKGTLEPALIEYQKSRTMRRRILDSDQSDFQSNRECFVSCMKMGEVRYLLGRTAEAKTDFNEALQISDAMYALDPQNTLSRRFQSFSVERLADIAIEENNPDDALKFAQRSLSISRELFENDRANIQAEYDVSICCSKVAKVLHSKGDFDAAIEMYLEALKIAQNIHGRESTNENLQTMVILHAKLSDVESSAGQFERAEGYATEGLKQLESIPEQERSDAGSRLRRIQLLRLQGNALIQLRRFSDSQSSLEAGRQLAQQMLADQQRAESVQGELEEIERLLMSLESANKN